MSGNAKPYGHVCFDRDIQLPAAHAELCPCDSCWKQRYRHMLLVLVDAGGLESQVAAARKLLEEDPDNE